MKIDLTPEEIEKRLFDAAVKNLKTFGYPEVNEDNIKTDELYKNFFISMLKDNLGNSTQIDNVINKVLNDISK